MLISRRFLHRCDAEGFRSPKEGVSEALLFASVQQYFENASFDAKGKVRCTDLPPIYFQHQGHSMTIVGLERRTSGALELLVFDPMFHGPTGIKLLVELLGRGSSAANGSPKENKKNLAYRNPDRALKMYRRGHKYLKRYHEFEMLKYVMSFLEVPRILRCSYTIAFKRHFLFPLFLVLCGLAAFSY
jgi:hypothetical protein